MKSMFPKTPADFINSIVKGAYLINSYGIIKK